MTIQIRVCGFALALALVSSPARTIAEPVKLIVSDGTSASEGQGWLYRDEVSGVCAVVTAAHVVSVDGKMHPVEVLSRQRGQGEAVDVQILSPRPHPETGEQGLDLAAFRVIGTIAENGCTSSTLGASDETALLNKRIGEILIDDVRGNSDSSGNNLITEISIKSIGDRNISFHPANAGDSIKQGFSGSAITTRVGQADGVGVTIPIAMVTEVEPGGLSTALRFDAIRRMLLGHSFRDSSETRNRPSDKRREADDPHKIKYLGSSGSNFDMNCQPSHAIAPSSTCGWRATPLPGAHEVYLDIVAKIIPVQGITLKLEPSNALFLINVQAIDREDGNFVPISSKNTQGGDIRINFLPSEINYLRIVVSSNSSHIEISNLSAF